MIDAVEGAVSPTKKKAALILGGPVKVPPGLKLPFRLSCSTAGPGAGSSSIVIAFDGVRVKKAVNRQKGEFELVPSEKGLSLYRNGHLFIERVEVQPVVFHAPEQAFFNLDNRCIYGCAFCASPMLDESLEKGHTAGSIIEEIVSAYRKQGFAAVAITSGVPDSPEATVRRIIEAVRMVKEALPELVIGVEPYISDLRQIGALREAGAEEIKINLEACNRSIFEKVCPGKDYEQVLSSIARAVEVFGRGRVTSNLNIGLGEKDCDVIEAVDRLALMGCVATLRALRANGFNQVRLEAAIGEIEPVSEERLLRLAKAQKEILQKHGLSTNTFQTMCHKCGCCDIVPFKDAM